MVYCISDIHGELDRFQQMLELIRFSDDDTLYIIGDVIDRAPNGVEILKIIMASPNMVMLLGNHEQMCLSTLGSNNRVGARDLWKQNGGSNTYRELVYHMDVHKRNQILRFLSGLPDHLEVEVNGKQFHLVHGMPADNTEDRVWERPDKEKWTPTPSVTYIIGHTPTCYITKNFEETFKIWHSDGIIDIDCGCGNNTEHRRLACLRLDDMKEFYV